MNKKILLLLLLIIIITAKTLSPSLNNNFTNWDDPEYVTENEHIKELSMENIKIFFAEPLVAHYSPLVLITYATEYKLFNLNPKAYHTTNLIFHVLNCLLVFWMIYLISGGQVVISFIVALLFGIHPTHVESIAWISERKDLLYSFFFLLSIITYFLYKKKNQLKFYIISIVLLILSLFSKSMAVTLPCVLLLIDFFVLKKMNKRIILEKIPYFVVSAVFAILILKITYETQNTRVSEIYSYSFVRNTLVANYNILFYLKQLILPINLSAFYPYPAGFFNKIPLLFVLSPVFVLVLAFGVFYSKKYTNKIIFGSLFFLITVSPVLQLIPAGDAISADRYTYIPYIGLFYIGAIFFLWLWNQKRNNSDVKRVFLAGILLVIVTLFAVLTNKRCKVWETSETLWTDVSEKYPTNTLAHYNLGHIYQMQGLTDNAIAAYNKALQEEGNFNYSDIYNNLGVAYLNKQMYNEAIIELKKGARLAPQNAQLLFNLGSAFQNNGLTNEAEIYLTKTLELNPNHLGALMSIGLLYANRNEFNEAIYQWEKVLKLYPGNADAQNYINIVMNMINKE